MVLALRTIQAWYFYWFRIWPTLKRRAVISDRWMYGYLADQHFVTAPPPKQNSYWDSDLSLTLLFSERKP